MINKLLVRLIGGGSLRYQMTMVYLAVYLLITFSGKMDAIAFGTFSGVFGVWIVSETARKAGEENAGS